MSATKTYKTRKFIEPAIVLRWFAFGVISLALVASWFMGQERLRKTVSVEPDAEDYVEVGSLSVSPTAIGALRIKAEANIPRNHWVTYELILLDRDGEVITSAMKEAWSESGTWSEDGETGTWEEDDLNAGLDIKLRQSETFTVAVSVLDYTTTSGQEVTDAVPIAVQVSTGVPYRLPLWWGWLVTVTLTWLTGRLIRSGCGRRAIFKTIPDSDIGSRGTLGGAFRLVQLQLEILSDETTPASLTPQLWIRNADGEDLYRQSYTVIPNGSGTDRRKSTLDVYFRLLEKGSYGFYVEVVPDASIDRTTLTVWDGVKTVGAVTVTDIDNVAIAILEEMDTSMTSINNQPRDENSD